MPDPRVHPPREKPCNVWRDRIEPVCMAMAGEHEDLLFSRYRKRGDPDLLAQVFDRTAPRLLRLAIHLSRDPAQAEDLVQATFVTAIEKARQFDAGRPVLPWLTGILEHHAREARSRANRAIVPERLRERPVTTPPQHAESKELDDAVARGLDQLPELYRTVMVLKLRHGLKPAQIADALGRSPGTVRVQIHRGTELLRNCLPVGLALSTALGLTPTLGLAAMRSEIKAHAMAHAALAAHTLGIGGLLMKKTTTAVLGLLVLTGTALYVGTDSGPAPLIDGRGVAEQQSSGVALAEELVADADLASKRLPTAPAPRRTLIPAEPTGGAIVLRTLWADDRTPARGIGLTVRPHDGRHPDLYTERRVSDRDGTALFDDLEAGDYGVYVDRDARQLRDDARAESGEPLAEELELGASLREHSIVLQELTAQLQSHSSGEFVITQRFAPQELYSRQVVGVLESFRELQTGLEMKNPDQPSLEELRELLNNLQASSRLPDEDPVALETVGDEIVYVDLLIDRGLVVKGQVFDPDGLPVADAGIWVQGRSRGDAHLVVRSDAEGRFQLLGMEPNSRVWARAAGFLASGEISIRKNQTEGLELRFTEHAVSLRATVVDQLGQPVAGASVRVGDPGGDPKPVQLRSDAQGMVATDGIRPGQIPVLVLAAGYQPYRELLDIRTEQDGAAERQFTLEPGWIAEGHLRNFEGEGQEGTTIFADAGGKPTTEVTTGPGGTFRLECLPPGPVSLRVEEGDYRALVVPVQGSSGDVQTHDLVLLPWGEISGYIVDDLGQALQGWQVRAVAEDDGPRSGRSDEHGAFSIDAVPELSYRLEVQPPRGETFTFVRTSAGQQAGELNLVTHVEYAFDTSTTGSGWKTIAVTWLGPVTGVRDDVEIVIPSDLVPSARVRGRIADAGGSPLKGSIVVHVDGGSRRERLDQQGAFDIGPLIPGDYQFQVVSTSQAFPSFYLDVDSLMPHQDLDLGAVVPPLGGSLDVSVLGGVSEPGSLTGRIVDDRGRVLATLKTLDPLGHTVPLAPGDYTVEVLNGDTVVNARRARVFAGETTRLSIELR